MIGVVDSLTFPETYSSSFSSAPLSRLSNAMMKLISRHTVGHHLKLRRLENDLSSLTYDALQGLGKLVIGL